MTTNLSSGGFGDVAKEDDVPDSAQTICITRYMATLEIGCLL